MNQEKYQLLQSAICAAGSVDYPVHSRVHPLRTFKKQCYIKRDDELGFGISGTKVRKFRSLLPFLQKHQVDTALLIGGTHSNNLLGLVQILIESGIKPLLFLRGQSRSTQGIHLLIRLFVPTSSIVWIAREEWSQVDQIAQEYANKLNEKGCRAMVIPEGSALDAAIPGASTLALDIVRNEKNLDLEFEHLFLDAGTGMTAIANLLAFSWLEKAIKMHVVLIAGTATTFENTLKRFHCSFERWLNQPVPYPTNYALYPPISGHSFGSVNRTLIGAVSHLAASEGFITDPIYSAKLLLTAKSLIDNASFSGNVLMLHSGGGLALSGYQNLLEKSI